MQLFTFKYTHDNKSFTDYIIAQDKAMAKALFIKQFPYVDIDFVKIECRIDNVNCFNAIMIDPFNSDGYSHGIYNM